MKLVHVQSGCRADVPDEKASSLLATGSWQSADDKPAESAKPAAKRAK